VLLTSMDSVSRVQALVLFTDHGTARVALPAGHYTAVTFFADFNAQGNWIAGRWVTPEFTVPDTSAVTTVPISEKSATARVSASVAVARPPKENVLVTTFLPQDAATRCARPAAQAAR
jgi:hypothetical protein